MRLILLLLLLNFTQAFGADQPTTPGEHKKQACAVTGQTFDLYLPKAYAEKPEKQFPALYLSSPGGNPGFHKLQDWAEKNEVILITINESRNGPGEPILAAQEAVWTATAYLRLHPCLRFSMGFSGAALASLWLAQRKDKAFAACLLHCHSGDLDKIPKHLGLAFICGEKDSTQLPLWIHDSVKKYGKNHFVMSACVSGMGHEWRDGEQQEQFLSSLLLYSQLTHPGIDKNERQGQLDAYAKALDAIDKPIQERLALAEPMLACETLRKEALWQKAADLWCAATAEKIAAAGTGLEAYKLLVQDDTTARLKLAKSSKAAVDKAIKPVLANPELRKEIAAYTAFQALAEQESKARDKGKFKIDDFAKRYLKLAQANPGTWAAELATAAKETLDKH